MVEHALVETPRGGCFFAQTRHVGNVQLLLRPPPRPKVWTIVLDAFEGIQAPMSEATRSTSPACDLSPGVTFETDALPALVFLVSLNPKVVRMALISLARKRRPAGRFVTFVVLALVLARAYHAIPFVADALCTLLDAPEKLTVVYDRVLGKIRAKPSLCIVFSALLAGLAPPLFLRPIDDPDNSDGDVDEEFGVDLSPLQARFVHILQDAIFVVMSMPGVGPHKAHVAFAHYHLLGETMRRVLDGLVFPRFLVRGIMQHPGEVFPSGFVKKWVDAIDSVVAKKDDPHARMRLYGPLGLARLIMTGVRGEFTCDACGAHHAPFECERCRRSYCGTTCQEACHGHGKKCPRNCHMCRFRPALAGKKTCSIQCANRRALRLHKRFTQKPKRPSGGLANSAPSLPRTSVTTEQRFT
jgi:hypothetical protein